MLRKAVGDRPGRKRTATQQSEDFPPCRVRQGAEDVRHEGQCDTCFDILQNIKLSRVTPAVERPRTTPLQAAMRSSRLPAVKQLRDFDFTFQPSLRREQIDSLHELGFVERRENVIFLGPPGVGKTHLAISLAIAAAQSGRRVRRRPQVVSRRG